MSTSSSTNSIVTAAPVLSVASAGMVSTLLALSMKSASVAPVASSGITATVTSKATAEARSSSAVTVVVKPSVKPLGNSWSGSGDSASVTTGVASSSVTVTDAPVTGRSPESLPLILIVAFPSSTSSFVGVTMNMFSPLREPASMVIWNVWRSTRKSTFQGRLRSAMSTVTALRFSRASPFSLAVTVIVVSPSPSATEAGSTVSSIAVAGLSSSVSVIVAGLTVSVPDTPVTVTVSGPSLRSSLTGVRVNSPVAA